MTGDSELIEQVLAGDVDAVEQFYRRYRPVVCAVLNRMVGGDAEDVAQEVFLRALAHLGRFRGDASLSWWLSRIAAHCGMRHLRGKSRAEAHLRAVELPSLPATPEAEVLALEERTDARRALARVPDSDREILELRELLGLSYDEIQSRLKLRHLGTVRSRLHKARESLRRAWRALRG